jgi:hypothetical protein
MKGFTPVGVAAAAVALAVLVTACGGSSSPSSPSPSPQSSSSSGNVAGATISGTVNATASGSAAGYAKLGGTGITITIAGTNIYVSTDSQGRFVLTGVPSGTIQLVVTSPTGTATLTLEGVQATDTIKIQVTVKGTTATVDTEERNGAAVSELEDRVSSIPAGTARTLIVGTTSVSVPAAVTIRHGDTPVEFTAIKVGDRVHVRGALSGGSMVATEVNVQNTNDNAPVNASGTVAALAKVGSGCPTIQFTVGGWTVETGASTDFQKAACTTIANGTSVHVKGSVLASSGHVLADWVQVAK